MNTLNFQKIAFEAINAVTSTNKDALRNAALALPHLLRAHGLAATVTFGETSDEHTKSIANALVSALHGVCAINGTALTEKVANNLLTEAQATYLLHSRLALKLADGMALAARALWPSDTNIQQENV